MKPQFSLTLALILGLLCLYGVAAAQKQAPIDKPEVAQQQADLFAQAANSKSSEAEDDAVPKGYSIKPGLPLKQLATELKARGIEYGFAFQVSIRDPDEDHWGFQLDPEHTHVFVCYSKKSQRVTDVALIFKPSPSSPRSTQSWMPVHQLILHNDGTYTAHFKAPARQ